MSAPSSPAASLSVRRLSKRYGDKLAVDDLSFTVARGEIVGLLGPNGAGKTTTINMLLGVLEPSAGSIEIEGISLAAERSRALAQANFAAVYAALPGNLTVRQNLRFFSLIYSVPAASARVEQLIDELDLRALRDTKTGLLSSGEQTRVALAKALLNQPRLLLLDEPTASLDPASADAIRRRIKALANSAECGVLWTSHNMYEVEQVCDRVLFLADGRVLLAGDPRKLAAEHGAPSLDALFIRLANHRGALDAPAQGREAT